MTKIDTSTLKKMVEAAWAVEFTPEEKRRYAQMWRRDNREEVRETMRERFNDEFSDDYENKEEAREAFVQACEEQLEGNT